MTEHEQQPSDQATGAEQRRCKLRRRARIGIAAFVLVGLGAVVGAVAVGAIGASAYGGYWHHGAGHGMENAERYVQRKATWVLRALDATPAQEQQVEAVLSSTLGEVFPLIEQHRENRASWREELSKPEVDLAALETLRGKELMVIDSISVSLLDALGDVAEILTPAQRRELVDGMLHHHH